MVRACPLLSGRVSLDPHGPIASFSGTLAALRRPSPPPMANATGRPQAARGLQMVSMSMAEWDRAARGERELRQAAHVYPDGGLPLRAYMFPDLFGLQLARSGLQRLWRISAFYANINSSSHASPTQRHRRY